MTDEQKNQDFVQLYRRHIDSIVELASHKVAFELFMFFVKYMDGSNALIVSNNVLQEVLGYGKAAICRAVKFLKENGWICVLKSGTSNVYIVNPEVTWTSYGNQKQYCKFQSTVILSGSDNAEYLNNPKARNFYKQIDENFVDFVKAMKKN